MTKKLLSSIKDVRAVDAHTVDIETNGANPLLVNNLTNMFMMDKGWATANDVLTPHDVAKGETNFATMNTNGTGAFMGQRYLPKSSYRYHLYSYPICLNACGCFTVR